MTADALNLATLEPTHGLRNFAQPSHISQQHNRRSSASVDRAATTKGTTP
jgi:hypothetical protein